MKKFVIIFAFVAITCRKIQNKIVLIFHTFCSSFSEFSFVTGQGGRCFGRNEVFTDCGPVDNCEATCKNPLLIGVVCQEICVEKCVCKAGYVRNAKKNCVLKQKCPKCKETLINKGSINLNYS